MTRSSSAVSPVPSVKAVRPDRQDYRTLADLRYLIRRFLKVSQDAAHDNGLTPRQYQALLVIKGFPSDGGPAIGELAEKLCIHHNSAVELVDRLVEARLISRTLDTQDRRRVLLGLTDTAEWHFSRLSATHLEELNRLRPMLLRVLERTSEPSAGSVPT